MTHDELIKLIRETAKKAQRNLPPSGLRGVTEQDRYAYNIGYADAFAELAELIQAEEKK